MKRLSNIVGCLYKNISGLEFIVTYYKSHSDVGARFTTTGYETKASKNNIMQGKVRDYLHPSVSGVGFNSSGITRSGKVRHTWSNMLKRCYNLEYQKKLAPSYMGCTVCTGWHDFTNFEVWMEFQDYKGKCLDKDLKNPNAKVYSPENCMFISDRLNKVIHGKHASKSNLKVGAFYANKGKTIFRSCITVGGKTKELGRFGTEEEAHQAYLREKLSVLLMETVKQDDTRIVRGLFRHSLLLVKKLSPWKAS